MIFMCAEKDIIVKPAATEFNAFLLYCADNTRVVYILMFFHRREKKVKLFTFTR